MLAAVTRGIGSRASVLQRTRSCAWRVVPFHFSTRARRRSVVASRRATWEASVCNCIESDIIVCSACECRRDRARVEAVEVVGGANDTEGHRSTRQVRGRPIISGATSDRTECLSWLSSTCASKGRHSLLRITDRRRVPHASFTR
jgi:hypothetical protein